MVYCLFKALDKDVEKRLSLQKTNTKTVSYERSVKNSELVFRARFLLYTMGNTKSNNQNTAASSNEGGGQANFMPFCQGHGWPKCVFTSCLEASLPNSTG